MKPIAPPLLIALALLLALPAHAGETVRIENASHPTRCAEDDNVYVKFEGAGVRHFGIEARPPVYAVTEDIDAPDFANCDQSHDPSYPSVPKDVLLWQDADWMLVGHTYAGFWRPESIDFRVGRTVAHGLHLVQLIRKIGGRRVEILVLYPADGYWRAKPLPADDKPDTAYGSSFLIGPIEDEGRPFVRLSSVAFDPRRLEFHLVFKNGAGSLRIMSATRAATRLEVELPAQTRDAPFAALRSMYVSDEMADTAEIGVGNHTSPILAPFDTVASDVSFFRSRPSRHNTSAPDLRFFDFGRRR
ncbi:MAG TPA: hypothetical protein VKZ79_19755 [Alphaproteobacteria bacterium]|nr:hypothetical protein [Alphaproteobacteria bacterium]